MDDTVLDTSLSPGMDDEVVTATPLFTLSWKKGCNRACRLLEILAPLRTPSAFFSRYVGGSFWEGCLCCCCVRATGAEPWVTWAEPQNGASATMTLARCGWKLLLELLALLLLLVEAALDEATLGSLLNVSRVWWRWLLPRCWGGRWAGSWESDSAVGFW